MSSALASFSRLSPSRIFSSLCGSFTCRITAVAAAASGGATMAPSAIATGHNMPGTSQRATSATASTVVPTAAMARPATGRQFARRSRNEVSKAASSSTGATKRASASCGSSVQFGLAGT